MQPIDIGDFALSPHSETLQQALFEAVRSRIMNGLWCNGGKLPSTRKFADALDISRNTVIAAYDQLAAEGYIESRKGSGFFVMLNIPDRYIQMDSGSVLKMEKSQHSTRQLTQQALTSFSSLNQPFAPGIPDLKVFPYNKWQRVVQRHLTRPLLSGHSDLQGLPSLRQALSDYLSSSRSVDCEPGRIIITSGAQQALSIAIMATLKPGHKVMIENPGYAQVRKALELSRAELSPVTVSPYHGLRLDEVRQQHADALYITPSNQYPLGTSLNTEQRLVLIEWANQHNSWIIEDDYDSEFQFAHRPYTSLQGLASQAGGMNRCIYIGSFSKTMFNALRIGYMVVP
ncbi:PLP-dependent aminotransferase family protein, partial [Photobacterium sp. OFAV2-7]|uniref:MocR-like pyridoxine biosynthesis transcription factor PdxR n=1 Tax=Photobacterium sp. OFAV2-7 TaxID=2917748 RepID=UPI001EF61F0B